MTVFGPVLSTFTIMVTPLIPKLFELDWKVQTLPAEMDVGEQVAAKTVKANGVADKTNRAEIRRDE